MESNWRRTVWEIGAGYLGIVKASRLLPQQPEIPPTVALWVAEVRHGSDHYGQLLGLTDDVHAPVSYLNFPIPPFPHQKFPFGYSCLPDHL